MNIPVGAVPAWVSANAEFAALVRWLDIVGVNVHSRHPLSALATLAAARQTVDALEDELVGIVRADGVSWSEVGSVLGMSRQAAWERFSKRLDA